MPYLQNVKQSILRRDFSLSLSLSLSLRIFELLFPASLLVKGNNSNNRERRSLCTHICIHMSLCIRIRIRVRMYLYVCGLTCVS